MKRIVLATRNQDKVREIQRIFSQGNIELVSLDDFPNAADVEEDGDTLHANALKKARCTQQWTGLPAMADDTGLEVDALNGAPGVYSSRFAGEDATYKDNNEKLLRDLYGLQDTGRTARFRTVVAFTDGKTEHCVEGVCEGLILNQLRGLQGFGYDPLFYLPEMGKTFAEISTEEKNRVSHRGIAFRKMADWIVKY